MESPAISTLHLAELNQRFPHAFYVWSGIKGCYQLWCDERRGIDPYKFMDLLGPGGEYREPGGWVLDALYKTDPDTGEYQVGTKAGRKAWIQSLMDHKLLDKVKSDRIDLEMHQIRNGARFVNKQGRVFGQQDKTDKQRHMKRKLGG